MSTFLRVCKAQELTPGARRVVELNASEEVLVVNVAGTIYALSNICPHAGAALQRGTITDQVLSITLVGIHAVFGCLCQQQGLQRTHLYGCRV